MWSTGSSPSRFPTAAKQLWPAADLDLRVMISRDTRKLVRTPHGIEKKIYNIMRSAINIVQGLLKYRWSDLISILMELVQDELNIIFILFYH